MGKNPTLSDGYFAKKEPAWRLALMEAHELWHVLVLASTLFGAAGALLLLVAPLVFNSTPPGLGKARPIILGLLVFAGALFLGEWLVVH